VISHPKKGMKPGRPDKMRTKRDPPVLAKPDVKKRAEHRGEKNKKISSPALSKKRGK